MIIMNTPTIHGTITHCPSLKGKQLSHYRVVRCLFAYFFPGPDLSEYVNAAAMKKECCPDLYRDPFVYRPEVASLFFVIPVINC